MPTATKKSTPDTAGAAALRELFDDFVPVSTIVELSGGKVSATTLAWWIKTRRTNGFAPYVRRCGRIYLISQSGFVQWFTARQGRWI